MLMWNWISRACIPWPGCTHSLYVYTKISMVNPVEARGQTRKWSFPFSELRWAYPVKGVRHFNGLPLLPWGKRPWWGGGGGFHQMWMKTWWMLFTFDLRHSDKVFFPLAAISVEGMTRVLVWGPQTNFSRSEGFWSTILGRYLVAHDTLALIVKPYKNFICANIDY